MCFSGDTNFKAFSFGVGKVLKDKSLMDDRERAEMEDVAAIADLEKDGMRIVVEEIMLVMKLVIGSDHLRSSHPRKWFPRSRARLRLSNEQVRLAGGN